MTQRSAWESHNLQVIGSNPIPATFHNKLLTFKFKLNMAKKNQAAAPSTNVAEATTTTTPPLQLSAMQLAALSFIVSAQYEKATQEEKECTATFHEDILRPLFENKLIEKAENGDLVATPFGVKWVLKSTTFGINFRKLFSKQVTENTSTLHAALFALAEELYDRHDESPIYFFEKDGVTPAKFYERFNAAITKLDNCLEARPQ